MLTRVASRVLKAGVTAGVASVALTGAALTWPGGVAFGQLVINGDQTNTTVLTAPGNGYTTITINNSTFTQTGSGALNAANGGVITINNTNVVGGLLSTSGDGVIRASNGGNNYLTGVRLAGTFDLATNTSQLRVQNGLAFGNGAATSGTINVNSNSILAFQGNQTLSGTGTIVLGGTGSSNRVTVEGDGVTLTVGPNVTIRGENGTVGGEIYVGGASTIANQGTITADVSGGLVDIQNSAVANTGTLAAANGGTLRFSSAVTNTGGGQITATDGGVALLNGTTVSGGTIVTGTGGLFRVTNDGNNYLSGVTLNGSMDLATNTSQARVLDGLTLSPGSTIGVNSNSILAFQGSQTLGGTGTIVLGGTGSSNRINVEGDGVTLTIGPDVTIRGENGTIGGEIYVGGASSIVNNGTIAADVSGGTVTISNSSVTNNGVLRAENGGTLVLSSDVTGNAGSQIAIGAGSVVLQNGVTVSGRINTSGTGAFQASNSGNNYLNAATLDGALDLASGTSQERVLGGLTLQTGSTIDVNSNSILAFQGTQTLDGTGTIVLGGTGSSNRINVEGDGVTLTIGPDVTIRGENGTIGGEIYVGGASSIVNNGTIAADVSGGTVSIANSALTNNGTLRAANGGTLVLSSDVTGNAGSQIAVGAGSVVFQNGVTVSGQVNTTGTGLYQVSNSGGNYFSMVTLNGKVDLASNTSQLRVLGGLTMKPGSTISVDNNSILAFQGTQTLGGTGTVVLGATGSANRVTVEGDDVTLTVGPNVTIRGKNGTIGGEAYVGGASRIVNDGTIAADVNGGTLTISDSPVTNNGTLRAANGGTLVLSSNVAGGASSQLATTAGSVIVQNGVMLSGRVNVTGGGVLQASNSGSNYLSGATFAGTLDLATGTSQERVTGGLTLGVGGSTSGTINVDNNSTLAIQGTQTVGGRGSIVLGATGSGNRVTVEGDGVTATIGPNVTIRGKNGTIGGEVYIGGASTLVNNGTIASDGGGTITVTNSALTNNGTLRAQNGTLALNTPLSGTGTLRVDAAGAVTLGSGAPATQGTLAMGAAGASLDLGTQNLTLTKDYTNAGAGTGNAFDRRAGVTGTGQILAGGNAAQAITGTTVTNGATATATLTIGNVRVGDNTVTYRIDNTGTTGPALRGAIQTSVNGGNITDARLSGSGVTAGNYGPAAPGMASGPYEVTFTAGSAGALAPLTGQAVNIRSAYENIGDQRINIVLGNGAAAYQVAQGQLNTPALNFGTVQVGQSVSRNLSFTNTATGAAGYVEDLNVGFGSASGTGAERISGTGSITGLRAGATGGGLTVTVNTGSAGTVDGSIRVNYTSAGAVNGVSNGLGAVSVGGANYGVSGTVSGLVVDQAAPVVNNAPINLGNVRIGAASPTAFVSVTNQATGNAQAALSASVAGNGPVTGSGSFTRLDPGATNASALRVGIKTNTAGAVSGNAVVSFVSDAGNIGNCAPNCELSLPSQNVAVSGAVYRLANPSVAPQSVTFAARVGDASPTQALSLTNSSPDAFTEALNSTFSGPAPAGFTTAGSVTGLAAGQTSTALTVGLNTATAGTFAGNASIANVSSGAGTTGAADLAVGSSSVALSGNVYTAAVGQVAPTAVDFGIVHVGDAAARTVGVTNGAAASALNDVLTGSISGGNAAFAVSGTLGLGVAAGATNNTSLKVTLNTAADGQFTGNAAVTLASHDAQLADLALGSTGLTLTGQVNNYAEAGLAQTGGAGAFSLLMPRRYLLDFGTLAAGGGPLSATLGVDNLASGFADLLNGNFSFMGQGFTLGGFDPFTGLAAGDRLGGYRITFDAATAGRFSGVLTLNAYGTNASGYRGDLAPIQLTVRGAVAGAPAVVPEPSTWAMLAAGLAGMGAAAARRRRRAA